MNGRALIAFGHSLLGNDAAASDGSVSLDISKTATTETSARSKDIPLFAITLIFQSIRYFYKATTVPVNIYVGRYKPEKYLP